jgi:hypothetical protein
MGDGKGKFVSFATPVKMVVERGRGLEYSRAKDKGEMYRRYG